MTDRTDSEELNELVILFKDTNDNEVFENIIIMLDKYISTNVFMTYKKFYKSSWYYALSFNDLRQESIIWVYGKTKTYDPERGAKFVTYLYNSHLYAYLVMRVAPRYRFIKSFNSVEDPSLSAHLNRIERDSGGTDEALKMFIPSIDVSLDWLEKQELVGIIAKYMDVLTDKQKDIIWSRMNGYRMQEIANKYNISRERVRQIEQKILERLRLMFNKDYQIIDD